MSLTRVLEPEVTQTVDEANLYDGMDHEKVNRCFVEDLIASCPMDPDEADGQPIRVLDLGTGTARIPIALCDRFHDAVRVFAVDLSIPMLDVARMNIELSGHQERIQLDCMDAKSMVMHDAHRFSVVMSNSLIHHLPAPQACLVHAVQLTEPGGRIFFRDLLRPESEPAVERLVCAYAGGESELAQQLFRDSLRAALELEEIRAMIAELGMDPHMVQQTSDRHWTWSAVAPGS